MYPLSLELLSQCPMLQPLDGNHYSRCGNMLKLHAFYNLLHRIISNSTALVAECMVETISSKTRSLTCNKIEEPLELLDLDK